MSQPGTPFDDTFIDPTLLSMGQGLFSPQQGLYDRGTTSSDQEYASSPADSNLLDLDDFMFNQTTNPSGNSISDFSGYNLGLGAHTDDIPFQPTYPPIPDPALPHPYPIQEQRATAHPDQQPRSSRPPLTRSETNTSASNSMYPYPPPYQHYASRVRVPYHRRSLSQSDADRISASLKLNPNPAFVRHLAPRSQPHTPAFSQYSAKKGKLGTRMMGGGSRCMSVEPGSRRMLKSGSSWPTVMPDIETSIGTPIHITGPSHEQGERYGSGYEEGGGGGAGAGAGANLQFRHMRYEDQIKESPRFIEIGAMAVLSTRSSTSLSRSSSETKNSKENLSLLQRLDDMERQLKQELRHDLCEKVIRGCEMIRGVLVQKAEEEEEEKKFSAGEAMSCINSDIKEPNVANIAPDEVSSITDMHTNQSVVKVEDDIF